MTGLVRPTVLRGAGRRIDGGGVPRPHRHQTSQGRPTRRHIAHIGHHPFVPLYLLIIPSCPQATWPPPARPPQPSPRLPVTTFPTNPSSKTSSSEQPPMETTTSALHQSAAGRVDLVGCCKNRRPFRTQQPATYSALSGGRTRAPRDWSPSKQRLAVGSYTWPNFLGTIYASRLGQPWIPMAIAESVPDRPCRAQWLQPRPRERHHGRGSHTLPLLCGIIEPRLMP